MNVKLRMSVGLGSLAALTAALVAALTVSAPASAYILSNGCDEYDPARAAYYQCVPDRTTFYTPDGVNPNSVPEGTGYPGETRQIAFLDDGGGSVNISDNVMIPPPAPYRAGRDYCSNPWYAYSAYEGIWQYSCYLHDVCYGSQKGRKYCDVRFWHDTIADCKSHHALYDPRRYDCFSDATAWYWAIRIAGAGHYVPRQSNLEPAGT